MKLSWGKQHCERIPWRISFRWNGGAAENNDQIFVIACLSLSGNTSIAYAKVSMSFGWRPVPFEFPLQNALVVSAVDIANQVDVDNSILGFDCYRPHLCQTECVLGRGYDCWEMVPLFLTQRSSMRIHQQWI